MKINRRQLDHITALLTAAGQTQTVSQCRSQMAEGLADLFEAGMGGFNREVFLLKTIGAGVGRMPVHVVYNGDMGQGVLGNTLFITMQLDGVRLSSVMSEEQRIEDRYGTQFTLTCKNLFDALRKEVGHG